MLVDLSAITNRSLVLLIAFASFFNFDQKLFLAARNSTMCTIVNKSGSNSDKLSTDGGHLFDLKPKISFLRESNFPTFSETFRFS